MAFFGGKMQGIESVSIAGVDVDAAFQVLEHLFQVA